MAGLVGLVGLVQPQEIQKYICHQAFTHSIAFGGQRVKETSEFKYLPWGASKFYRSWAEV